MISNSYGHLSDFFRKLAVSSNVHTPNFQEAIAARSYLSEKPEIYGKSEEEIEDALKVRWYMGNFEVAYARYCLFLEVMAYR